MCIYLNKLAKNILEIRKPCGFFCPAFFLKAPICGILNWVNDSAKNG